MKYKEMIHFEPITTVVKLVNAGELAVAETLVKTFVFSKKITGRHARSNHQEPYSKRFLRD